ncbi:glycoside hydrolase family 16 protein [Halobaculum lipolyticum]|uniref:Family 16 glycosylhydrolase n=1 Tax=Halobaculum lipolyticum TaxID=3032001 RepID=A0ABD5WBT9_9EURY|nr:glycoside hydrolase family 16 protein [Halobaculum sp. DT31]
MAHEKDVPTGGNSDSNGSTTDPTGDPADGARTDPADGATDDAPVDAADGGSGFGLPRRDYLKGLGLTAAAVGAIGVGSAAVPTAAGGDDDWVLAFEDDFDGDSLDTSNWALGWGWGLGAPGSKVSWARERHVNVSDSMLRLTASHEDFDDTGEIYVGAVHSKNRVTVEPPVYFEARCRFVEGVGWQNAFWSKPNTEAWPPEIDVVEYLQPRSSRAAETSHNLHYSASGEPGDGSTHRTVNGDYEGYDSEADWPGNRFHVYGFEWREDALRHYVDGQLVEETTDPDIVGAFNNGGPEYLMLSLNLDNVGTTDKSGSWAGREFLCDWVRVYDYAPDSGGSGGTGDGSTDSTDDTTDDGTDSTAESHYLWLRSGTGEEATFDLTVDGGNLRLDSSGFDADYTISEDGTAVSGTVSRQSSLPGMRYEGEIADLDYSGPLEMYIDNTQVDPDDYVTAEPEPEPESHYLWARSGDGDPVSFAFEAGAGNVRIEPADADADYWVADDGTVGGGTTARRSQLPGFRFDGEVVDLAYEGDLQLYLDNSAVDPASLVDESSPGPYGVERYGNTVSIAPVDGGSASYALSVDGDLAATAAPESADAVSASAATGTVDASADTYTFSGALTGLSVDGDAAVTVNGDRLDRLGVTRADGSSGTVRYLIETTGGVLGIGPSAADGDDTSADKVLGRVADGEDYFWLAGGEVVDVSTFGGEVVTTLNGTTIDRTD